MQEDSSNPQIHIDKIMLRQLLTVALVVSFCIAILVFLFVAIRGTSFNLFRKPSSVNLPQPGKLVAFKNAEEFKSYIQKGQDSASFGYFGGIGRATDLSFNAAEKSTAQGQPAPAAAPSRVSETNVQVKGIDEPDIVKTDGKHIYFSPQFFGGLYERALPPVAPQPVEDRKVMSAPSSLIFPAPDQKGTTHIINAFPPEGLEKIGSVDENGELLLDNGKLVVLSYNKLTAFDVSDSKNPKKTWEKELDNSSVVTSRLKDGKLILVTRNFVNISAPCPMPLFKGNATVTIACDRIYYPDQSVAVDSTYTVSLIDSQSGSVEQNISFVGSSGNSVVYVSPNAAYVSYTYPGDIVAFYHSFLDQKGRDLIPVSVISRLGEIKNYNISSTSKLHELQVTLEQYKASLSRDDALKLETELTNRMQDFSKDHARDLESTGIVKVSLQNLDVEGQGAVAGHPLNQFAIDEYNGDLRIATTVGRSFFVNNESTNDLYVLDRRMQVIGSILDLAPGEQVYSSRFIGDKAYIVTFKQIDPFFVIDLGNPRNPVKAGELKIPGYSSYLHPLRENTILGVGQEDGRVKLSLFDVNNAKNPVEVSKYTLSDYWTEVSNNHHAFLQDTKNEIFFIPGGQSGYIFSYKGNNIALVKAVADIVAKRALYIDNNLYIIGENKIVVLDEGNWQTIKSLSL